MLFIIGGITTIIYLNNNENTIKKTDSHDSNIKTTTSGGKITTEGTQGSHVSNTTVTKQEGDDEILYDENELILIKQTSVDECTDNYGLDGEDKMFTTDKCGGIFTYKGNYGFCMNITGEDKSECPIGTYGFDRKLNTIGLVKSELQLLEDTSDGKCTEDNYGMENYKQMYVKGDCKGKFRHGSLFGKCESYNNEKQLCNIGRTDKVYVKEDPTSETTTKTIQGLKKDNLEPYGSIDKGRCITNEDMGEILYGFEDADNFYVHDSCQGDFVWGYLKGKCGKEDGIKDICSIGITNETDSEKGLIMRD